MRIKKKIGLIVGAILTIGLTIGGSLAYISTETNILNTFAKNKTGVSVYTAEPNWNAFEGQNVVPGDVVKKDPLLLNTGEAAYARMIVTLTDKTTGEVITDKDKADKILSMIHYWTDEQAADMADFPTSEEAATYPTVNPLFTLDEGRSTEGIYCYNYVGTHQGFLANVIENGDQATLFSGVIVPRDWTGEDINEIRDFDISITTQTIQMAGINDVDEAFKALDEAKGKPNE